jgi:transposase InsO family protein
MKCILAQQGIDLLREIHSGLCGNHAGVKTIVGKAYRQGFYWPTAVTDATDVVKKCEGCQFFGRQTNVPAAELQTIPITWPFATWGLDIVGPFKVAKGGFTHIFVAIDKFTKWVEVKPVARITAAKAVEFISEIINRFGIPNRIITDNGSQFTAAEFRDFCRDHHIKIQYASVAHPQSNGQVERANGLLLQGLKPRIFNRLKPYAAKWIKELPSVLWALRTNPSRATGQSPFTLVYGSEVMLPTEVENRSFRVQHFQEQQSEDNRAMDLDQLEEIRDAAVIQLAKYQQAMRRYHARNMRKEASQLGISSCARYKQQKTDTSCRLYGKGRSSLMLSPGQELID